MVSRSRNWEAKEGSRYKEIGRLAVTRTWANNQRDGRPAEYKWRPGSGPAWIGCEWWPQTTHKLATTGSYAVHSEILRTEKGRRKGTEGTQRDKPLNGSRGKAPSVCKFAMFWTGAVSCVAMETRSFLGRSSVNGMSVVNYTARSREASNALCSLLNWEKN